MTEITSRLGAALAGRYQIVRQLGQGGMATVYLAEDLKHHRKVAVKVLRQELAAILGAERFLKEIEVTAGLQHPNILPLYDSGEADTLLYYVMPYIEGETLAERLKRERQLGVEETVRIAESVAAALEFAHARGVIHRDIKPANILLQSGQALVADFGIALAVSEAGGARLTETGLSLGTPHYMSPEQATGDRVLDARTDVYSLGAVVYEMLAGDPPHLGSTVQAVVAKVLAERAVSIRLSRPSVPRHMDAAVLKALAKIPADRFGSAAEFAVALTNPAFGASAGDSGAARRWQRLSLGAVALAATMTGLAVWGWGRSQPERPVIRYSMAIPEGEAVSSAAPVLGSRLALSPDATLLAYVGPGAAGVYQVWLRRRDQLNARPITGTENGRRPFFSPDGSRIGYFTAEQALRVVSLTGEPPTTLNRGDLSATGAAWGSDGYIYAAARGQGPGAERGIVRLSDQGGQVEAVTQLDSARGERVHEWPSVLPNGRGVLFSVITSPALSARRLAVADLRTGQHRHLVEGVAGWYVPTGHLIYVTADGTLIAAPFDPDRLEITGAGRAVLSNVGITVLGVDLTLSATGTLMYLTGASGFAVQPVWVDRYGNAQPVDPAWTFPAATLYSTSALSPDGSRLVVSQADESGQHLWVKQVPNGPNAKLTFEGSLNSRASWVPDGRSIVFVSDRTGVNQIWRQVADGSAPAELVVDRPANEGLYSPDGHWFIYRGIAGDRHIYAIRTAGDSTVLEVARSERGEDVAPTLSPDGKWIAYVSDESGRDEIYVRAFPDVSRMKRQVSTQGGVEPRWARSGRELYFRNPSDELVSVPVSLADGGFTPGTSRVLFSMSDYLPANRYQPSYEVSQGDQRFILTRRLGGRGGSAAGELIVVENFPAELRPRQER